MEALHLTRPHVRVADLPGRRVLRSVYSRHSSIPVAAAQLWNSLPDDIVLADSLSTFRRQLKHHLFQQSYPDVVL